MTDLTLHNLTKNYGAVDVIRGVDLDIKSGEFVVFVGPSGCGKSTLLRMIAGLEDISGGDLTIGGRRCNDLEPRDRGIAMVFQSYALYPHMSVRQNMSFGLSLAGTPKAKINEDVMAAARILKLEPLLDRKPSQLSGGQRQRVAIGRAIVRQPSVFLFDEPLSNLDAALRMDMRMEIARLHKELGATMIYVTHDQVEAMTLADRIVVLEGGRVQQIGAPIDVYKSPANRFVAGFIGSPRMNFLPVSVTAATADTATVSAPSLAPITLPAKGFAAGQSAVLGLRPQYLHRQPAPGMSARVSGQVVLVERLGAETVVNLRTSDDQQVLAVLPQDAAFGAGETVDFHFEPAAAHLFAAEA
ncbi:ABC transporter ATP-binding protein [Pararhodobacter zhoushanensis]|uniref:ABC transporter ATP-binding protein n=1 Tax=Pararhodobacter zhoushanensis TaxID=2479545 RepID=UPI000F8E130C|nr:sn-glycerol-3-phosphate ABC transporter ATP-binding protein UgpC [Pararhodobacter zhoushanensis]